MPTTRAPQEAAATAPAAETAESAPMRVGAADDQFEVAADAAADRALSRLAAAGELGAADVRRAAGGGGGMGLVGGDLDRDTQARIESSRGGGSTLPTPL